MSSQTIIKYTLIIFNICALCYLLFTICNNLYHETFLPIFCFLKLMFMQSFVVAKWACSYIYYYHFVDKWLPGPTRRLVDKISPEEMPLPTPNEFTELLYAAMQWDVAFTVIIIISLIIKHYHDKDKRSLIIWLPFIGISFFSMLLCCWIIYSWFLIGWWYHVFFTGLQRGTAENCLPIFHFLEETDLLKKADVTAYIEGTSKIYFFAGMVIGFLIILLVIVSLWMYKYPAKTQQTIIEPNIDITKQQKILISLGLVSFIAIFVTLWRARPFKYKLLMWWWWYETRIYQPTFKSYSLGILNQTINVYVLVWWICLIAFMYALLLEIWRFNRPLFTKPVLTQKDFAEFLRNSNRFLHIIIYFFAFVCINACIPTSNHKVYILMAWVWLIVHLLFFSVKGLLLMFPYIVKYLKIQRLNLQSLKNSYQKSFKNIFEKNFDYEDPVIFFIFYCITVFLITIIIGWLCNKFPTLEQWWRFFDRQIYYSKPQWTHTQIIIYNSALLGLTRASGVLAIFDLLYTIWVVHLLMKAKKNPTFFLLLMLAKWLFILVILFMEFERSFMVAAKLLFQGHEECEWSSYGIFMEKFMKTDVRLRIIRFRALELLVFTPEFICSSLGIFIRAYYDIRSGKNTDFRYYLILFILNMIITLTTQIWFDKIVVAYFIWSQIP